MECRLGAVCVLDENEEASCQCDFQCPKSVKSVCGSDELTYDNDCERASAQCKLQTKIDLIKNGPCVKDPCENVECPPNQECLASFDGASARCACKGPCPDVDNPGALVCGSDGQDYPSLCHLGDVQLLPSGIPLQLIPALLQRCSQMLIQSGKQIHRSFHFAELRMQLQHNLLRQSDDSLPAIQAQSVLNWKLNFSCREGELHCWE